VTLKSYRRDYQIIKDLIPDIQLRNIRTPDINKLFKALIAEDGDDIRATSSYRNVRNFLSGAFFAQWKVPGHLRPDHSVQRLDGREFLRRPA
jgi:hypothetical protein